MNHQKNSPSSSTHLQFLKLPEVLGIVGMSKDAWRRRQKNDGAPMPIKMSLGVKPIARSTPSRYLASDIYAYMQRKIDMHLVEVKVDAITNLSLKPSGSLKKVHDLIELINLNRILIDTVARYRVLEPEDFLWGEIQNLIRELKDAVQDAYNSFAEELQNEQA